MGVGLVTALLLVTRCGIEAHRKAEHGAGAFLGTTTAGGANRCQQPDSTRIGPELLGLEIFLEIMRKKG